MKQIYVTDDGQHFESQEAAERYESSGINKAVIEAWVEKFYNNSRVNKKNLNVILAWETYRDEVMSAV